MIRLVRADERLIHGQTMQFVVPDYSIRRIIVVDDLTTTNPLLKSIFEAAIPKTIQATVCTVEQAKEIVEPAITDSEATLLLVKYPRTFLKLRSLIAGLPNELNIGSQMAKNGTRYTEYASLSAEDVKACEELAKDNVRVYFNAIGSSGSFVEWK
jgi:mannose/fructose/N-acetylgalactosamine-specific phosphotransferase system component IIB